MPFLKRCAPALPPLYLPLLIVLTFAQTWRTLGGGDDFWAHAAVGRWMV